VHDLDLILTLAGGFTAALLLGYLTHRLGLSPIVGYLLAGTLVGPNTPGFVADASIAEQLAEVGVILLMFGVGLQFHLDELMAVRRVALPGALIQSAAATALGFVIARAIGWSVQAGLIFGIALSVASTVVLVRVLSDNRDLHTRTGHIAVGWLVVEDLLTIVALVLLPVLVGSRASVGALGGALAVTAVKVGALVAFTIVVGSRVIPALLDRVAATRSRELFTLTVLAVALGIAVGASLVFDVSVALGAFLAGMVVGRSDYSHRAAIEALPMRDAFAVLFFVSVGMLLEPQTVLDAPGLLAATLAVVLVGKPLAAIVIVRLLGYPFRVSLSVAIALAQIGEFSFILSSLGRELGVLDDVAANTLVAASIVSIMVNPLLYRAIPSIERAGSSQAWLRRLLNARNAPVEVMDLQPGSDRAAAGATRHRAVVVGYGPTGRTVTRLLTENGIEPTVIELSMTSVRELKNQGIRAVYGDAVHRETLQAAGVAQAASLVLTSAGMSDTAEVIRNARDLNPSAYVLARTDYLRDLSRLRSAGADDVFTGEGEVALAFSEALLERLGATPEQLDRERDRAHNELFGRDGHDAPADATKTQRTGDGAR
jgi:CPA2 family monovalent cation:H+ antiporter-2